MEGLEMFAYCSSLQLIWDSQMVCLVQFFIGVVWNIWTNQGKSTLCLSASVYFSVSLSPCLSLSYHPVFLYPFRAYRIFSVSAFISLAISLSLTIPYKTYKNIALHHETKHDIYNHYIKTALNLFFCFPSSFFSCIDLHISRLRQCIKTEDPQQDRQD